MALLGRYLNHLNHLKTNSPALFHHSCRSYAAKKSFREKYQALFYPQRPEAPYDFVCQIGDPVLRQKCDLVDEQLIGLPKFQSFIELMWKVHKLYGCVGLSAPQLGLPLQVVVIGCTEEECKAAKSVFVQPIAKKVLINPVMKVLNYKSKVTGPEACASMCCYSALVSRFSEVRVEALNEKGTKIAFDANGFEARIIQHEIDHLSGTMYVDKMEPRTLECSVWQNVNVRKGNCQIRFKPIKDSLLHKMKLI
ncbi:peptide deformylase, mitochondrial-like [Thrips palmi]|uniref:Peptide deformylase n=1 Tax=Thrips palmi TaxID=161013 RepID=A0A6P8ZQ54_THRPL|nr:peptide deformylase, mitochondrial-like [Thrips palmi]